MLVKRNGSDEQSEEWNQVIGQGSQRHVETGEHIQKNDHGEEVLEERENDQAEPDSL
jgi:hypothetical protein